ncbi:hypothetical protein N7532_004608 [Penicillium argentinense]|uniref:Stress response protein NST1 n=1 Tax=Penicillium argentinense TaxID=1131581 RepID=A0A9W9FPP5_9EURO|nr:uncharacterized protein N7532_004608 [Penicillium argentinense]KAJ5104079.1 hypothetical protein N7532_004608 [Penicillium argentinense]
MAAHPSAVLTPSTEGDARGPLSHSTVDPTSGSAPVVNRKKQKRRQKQAARLAADHADPHASGDPMDPVDDRHLPDDIGDHESADLNHHRPGDVEKKRNKKGRSGSHTIADGSSTPISTPSATFSHPPPPHSLSFPTRFPAKSAKESSIWNQSSLVERENIRAFWFELGEDERRQLVKVEKDAVLKKMKEQQRHSCSCTICGRKRTAIEEELEILYDAYYEELEQYAHNNQDSFEEGAPIIPAPRLYQPPLRSNGEHTHAHGQSYSSRDRIRELPEDHEDPEDDYDDGEEEHDEEDDDELYSDEEFDDEEPHPAPPDFFAFGNSLTVKDGILTVADDLLKNDGKHFIDMMEQLAERRMQREEDTQYNIAAAHQSFHAGHNHGPLDDEDYDEEEDEDYDSQDEEEEFDADEMDSMTEEQRMQEGRRMFQIFAARMFEQRVMTAYREKVAEQRQKQLIEELLEEETRNEQRNAKKAREAQKKKDKKRLQKQAKEEEKARRDAEKAAEEAAAKAAQEKKQEEQRLKREEQRKKREAERKAQEEERARKEAEKQRRLKEDRERQAQAERKQREQKEEKKRREEAKRKEKEEREREVQEKKAKEEQQRRSEEQAKKDRENAARMEQEVRDRVGKAQTQARAGHAAAVPLAPSLQSQAAPGPHQSPHHSMASPAVPKASTPVKPRQSSQHGSHTSSPHSQAASSDVPLQPSVSPRSLAQSYSGAPGLGARPGPHQQPFLHHPQPSAPLSPLSRTNPSGYPGIGGRPIPPELQMYSPNSGMINSRGFNGPGGIPAPPGINGVRPLHPGRGFPPDIGHGLPFPGPHGVPGMPGVPGAFPMQQAGLAKSHSRQPSGSFERSPLESAGQPFPISRPSPIKGPPSTAQDQQEGRQMSSRRDVDHLSTQLGSSALLDDIDDPYSSKLSQSLPGASAPGQFPPPTRASFQGSSLFAESAVKHPPFQAGDPNWGPPAPAPFGSPFPGASTWGMGSGGDWPHNAFGASGNHRMHTTRPVTIRLLVIQACKHLNTLSPRPGSGGYHNVNLVLNQVEQLRSSNEPAISLSEMLDICDTEGSPQNGGGSFFIKEDEHGRHVKFEPDTNSAMPGHRGSIVPGDIGSPIPGNSNPAAFGGFGTPSVFRQYSSPPTGLYGGTS